VYIELHNVLIIKNTEIILRNIIKNRQPAAIITKIISQKNTSQKRIQNAGDAQLATKIIIKFNFINIY
jgi:hypothetical protein